MISIFFIDKIVVANIFNALNLVFKPVSRTADFSQRHSSVSR